MSQTNYTSRDADGSISEINISNKGKSVVAEVTTITPEETTPRKIKKKVDLKKVPNQTDDTPKTKRRYYYEKTANYVSYARAKQLGLVN